MEECNSKISNCLSLKIGHHGSEAACTQPFLDVVNPKYAFVSADMRWSHPYTPTIERLLNHPSLNRTLANDPSHTIVHGTGGTAKRHYVRQKTRAEIYTNIVDFHTDTVDGDSTHSKKVSAALKKGDTPVVAEGVRYDLYIRLRDGAVRLGNSNQTNDDDYVEELD